MRQRYVLVFAERALVSREIHDTLLQNLAAIGIELEAVLRQLDPERTAAWTRCAACSIRPRTRSRKPAIWSSRCEGQLSRAPGLIDTLRESPPTRPSRAPRASV